MARRAEDAPRRTLGCVGAYGCLSAAGGAFRGWPCCRNLFRDMRGALSRSALRHRDPYGDTRCPVGMVLDHSSLSLRPEPASSSRSRHCQAIAATSRGEYTGPPPRRRRNSLRLGLVVPAPNTRRRLRTMSRRASAISRPRARIVPTGSRPSVLIEATKTNRVGVLEPRQDDAVRKRSITMLYDLFAALAWRPRGRGTIAMTQVTLPARRHPARGGTGDRPEALAVRSWNVLHILLTPAPERHAFTPRRVAAFPCRLQILRLAGTPGASIATYDMSSHCKNPALRFACNVDVKCLLS